MLVDPLIREKKLLRENQKELSDRFPGKYLLIKEEEVVGGFETYEQGVSVGAKLFGAGPFLVRSVLKPDDAEPPRIPALSAGVPFVVQTEIQVD